MTSPNGDKHLHKINETQEQNSITPTNNSTYLRPEYLYNAGVDHYQQIYPHDQVRQNIQIIQEFVAQYGIIPGFTSGPDNNISQQIQQFSSENFSTFSDHSQEMLKNENYQQIRIFTEINNKYQPTKETNHANQAIIDLIENELAPLIKQDTQSSNSNDFIVQGFKATPDNYKAKNTNLDFYANDTMQHGDTSTNPSQTYDQNFGSNGQTDNDTNTIGTPEEIQGISRSDILHTAKADSEIRKNLDHLRNLLPVRKDTRKANNENSQKFVQAWNAAALEAHAGNQQLKRAMESIIERVKAKQSPLFTTFTTFTTFKSS